MFVAFAFSTGPGAAQALWFRLVTFYTSSSGRKALDEGPSSDRAVSGCLPACVAARLDAQLVLSLNLAQLVLIYARLLLVLRRHSRARLLRLQRAARFYNAAVGVRLQRGSGVYARKLGQPPYAVNKVEGRFGPCAYRPE